MLKTIKAKVNSKGEVKLLERLKLTKEMNAILTILEDEFQETELTPTDMAALIEKSLAEDWNSEADSRWDIKLK